MLAYETKSYTAGIRTRWCAWTLHLMLLHISVYKAPVLHYFPGVVFYTAGMTQCIHALRKGWKVTCATRAGWIPTCTTHSSWKLTCACTTQTHAWLLQDPSNLVAHAAFRAMHDHVEVRKSEVVHRHRWDPKVLIGKKSSYPQDAVQFYKASRLHSINQNGATSGFEMCFAIGSQHLTCRESQPKHVSNPDFGIKNPPIWFMIACWQANGVWSFMLDDDNCYCQTTLEIGHDMCGSSVTSRFGVDLSDPGCGRSITN